jgi:predicted O-methyltransferase YrrM
MNEIIERIYDSGTVTGRSGRTHKLHSCIDRREAEFLSGIIRNDGSVRTTLEVGCAYGVSALVICSALAGRERISHTIIDPFQNTDWDGAGTLNLEAAGFRFFELIEKKSEFALPDLLHSGEGRFDLILVDGWHTFDHTLLDCFYATRLLRVGGYLAIDDVHFPSVRRVVDFLGNYPCYELFGSVSYEIKASWKKRLIRGLVSPVRRQTWGAILSSGLHRRIFDDAYSTMVALRKVAEDSRGWDWHEDLF